MLFPSVFQTFHRKIDRSVVLRGLNPEGPLDSYLSDVTLPALLITCQFSFCGTEKIKQDFLLGDKKYKFLLFLRSIFLFPVFFCSFLIPFTENLIIFIKAIFYILCLLVVVLRHAFSRLPYFSAQLSCLFLKSCIMIKIFCLFQVIH